MINKGKRNILGIDINAVDYNAAVDEISRAAKESRALGISALAVHGVMTGVTDREHRYRLNRLDLVVPDGQPVRWALNLLHGTGLTDRVYGPNLTLYTAERAAAEGLPIFLYGSQDKVLQAFAANLTAKYPGLQIAGMRQSAFRQVTADEKQEIVQEIRDSGARIVFVGLGCPRQEVWVYEHLEHLAMPMLAVGAAFDFHAGLLPQAPPWMQKRGLEWLYRLIQEPKRLWKRYLFLNPYFLFHLFLQWLHMPASKQSDAVAPKQELRYG